MRQPACLRLRGRETLIGRKSSNSYLNFGLTARMLKAQQDNVNNQGEDLAAAIDVLNVRSQRKQIRQELTNPCVNGARFQRELNQLCCCRYNRLHSISMDANFVQQVSRAYPDCPVVG